MIDSRLSPTPYLIINVGVPIIEMSNPFSNRFYFHHKSLQADEYILRVKKRYYRMATDKRPLVVLSILNAHWYISTQHSPVVISSLDSHSMWDTCAHAQKCDTSGAVGEERNGDLTHAPCDFLNLSSARECVSNLCIFSNSIITVWY